MCVYQYIDIHIDGSTGNEIKFCESYNYSNLFVFAVLKCIVFIAESLNSFIKLQVLNIRDNKLFPIGKVDIGTELIV